MITLVFTIAIHVIDFYIIVQSDNTCLQDIVSGRGICLCNNVQLIYNVMNFMIKLNI